MRVPEPPELSAATRFLAILLGLHGTEVFLKEI